MTRQAVRARRPWPCTIWSSPGTSGKHARFHLRFDDNEDESEGSAESDESSPGVRPPPHLCFLADREKALISHRMLDMGRPTAFYGPGPTTIIQCLWDILFANPIPVTECDAAVDSVAALMSAAKTGLGTVGSSINKARN